MTIKRRDGGSGTNGAAKSPSMFEAPPANETLPEPVATAPQPTALWFVTPDDPLVARLPAVDHPYVRANCKAEYAELACWAQMPDDEAVAFRMQPLLAHAAAAGQLPDPETQAQVGRKILASRASVVASVLAYGPTAERTVLLRVPLVQDQDGNFVPDPAVVGTGTETTAP
jgi:hypothetical protein